EKGRKARTAPDQRQLFIGILDDVETQSTANRFELSRIPLHFGYNTMRFRMFPEGLLFLLFSLPVEILEPVILQANEILVGAEPARGIIDFVEQINRILL